MKVKRSNRLIALCRKAKRGGWADWIRSEADERSLLEGCTFDLSAADRVRQFFPKFLIHGDGEWAGRPFELLDWEWDGIVAPLYGWKRADGLRRYRRAYISTAKKNGKSALASGLALYQLMADGEPGAIVCVAACDRAQAGIIFDESAHLVDRSPALSRRLQVLRGSKTIHFPLRAAVLKALSADAKTKEGIKASTVFCDELHVWPDDKLWSALRYAFASRRQPLFLVFTTAGVRKEGSICLGQYETAKGILDGTIHDSSFFPAIWESNEEDPIDEEETWKKANPGYGVTVRADQFREDVAEAKRDRAAEFRLRRYRLNQWVNASRPYIDPELWRAAAGEIPDALEGRPLIVGLDLADRDDANAVAFIWRDSDCYYVRMKFWCPEATIRRRAEQGQAPYHVWVAEGDLISIPGELTDQDRIKNEILAADARHHVHELAYDPWNAVKLAVELETEGITTVRIPQRMAHLAYPTRELEGILRRGELVHDGNLMMQWMFQNCSTYEDADGNIRPDKKSSRDKIDGVVALVTGLARVLVQPEQPRSVYEDRGVIDFE